MCLIVLAYDVSRGARLVLAANRDEFYDRPTAPAHFWPENPEILAGRDLRAGGTWLGVTRGGRFGALTNFREPSARRSGGPSRGGLVVDFLRSADAAGAYLERIASDSGRYNGFNLLLSDGVSFWSFANTTPPEARRLVPGVYGLSNHLFETPWPKVTRTKARLERLLLDGSAVPGTEELLSLLADRTKAEDGHLPRTGVPLEWEQLLSAPFVVSPSYGTRSSTVLVIGRDGVVRFSESTFFPGTADGATVEFCFEIPVAEDGPGAPP